MPRRQARRTAGDPAAAVMPCIGETYVIDGYEALTLQERMLWNAAAAMERLSHSPAAQSTPRPLHSWDLAGRGFEAIGLPEVQAIVLEVARLQATKLPEDASDEAQDAHYWAHVENMRRWGSIEAQTDFPAALGRYVDQSYPWA